MPSSPSTSARDEISIGRRRSKRFRSTAGMPLEWHTTMIYGPEHLEIQRSARKLIEAEINPHVDQWEEAGQFPAHEVFKKFGAQGFLGISKPEKFGGLG